jgi:enoyl-CoA hydratase/carnithine racemase
MSLSPEAPIADAEARLVLVERDGPVVIVTLNDPAVRNALSAALRNRLREVLTDLDRDTSCRAIVLTGAEGTFCSGGDVRVMGKGADPAGLRSRMKSAHEVVRLLVNGSTPVVAAIEGFAFGAGLSLAAASDVVVADTSARFGSAFGKVGLMPDMGLVWTLPRKIGLNRARQIMLLSESLQAQQAHEIDLVDELVEPGQVRQAALARAHAFARCAPLSLGMTRQALAINGTLDELLEFELEHQAKLIVSDDHAEGTAAFREKRPPQFSGR